MQNEMQNSPPPPPPSQQLPSQTIEFKLVNQGAYGCIYYPEISCDGKVGSPNYVSKIQINTQNVQNESELGKRISTIHNYEYRFCPIISSCPANINKLGEKIETEKCNLLYEKESEEPQQQPQTKKSRKMRKDVLQNLISTKIKFIPGKELDVFFEKYINSLNIPLQQPSQSQQQPQPQQQPTHKIPVISPAISTNIVVKMATVYRYLLISLEKLKEKGIIHYDIKEPNIMYDVNIQSPIIIDYGISFIPSQMTTPELHQSAFYTNKYYPYWCFDIFVLGFIVNNVRKTIPPSIEEKKEFSLEKLDELLNKYLIEMNTFLKKHAYPITTQEIEIFKMNQRKYFEKFAGKMWEDVFVDLFKPEIYDTWDHFSLAFTFFSMQKLFMTEYLNNANMDAFMKMWKSIILSGPTERKTITQALEEMKKIDITQYKPSVQPVAQTQPPTQPPPIQPPPIQPVAQPNKLEMAANIGLGAVAVKDIANEAKLFDNADEVVDVADVADNIA
jgi:serine/threonine protein kinase